MRVRNKARLVSVKGMRRSDLSDQWVYQAQFQLESGDTVEMLLSEDESRLLTKDFDSGNWVLTFERDDT